MLISTKNVTKQVYTWLSAISGLTVTLSMPESTATYPIAVITPPLEQGYMHKQYIDLRFTVEVWNDTQYNTMDTFDLVVAKMADNDIGLRNNTNIYQDIVTKKFRITGDFECRYNCITGTLEPNF